MWFRVAKAWMVEDEPDVPEFTEGTEIQPVGWVVDEYTRLFAVVVWERRLYLFPARLLEAVA